MQTVYEVSWINVVAAMSPGLLFLFVGTLAWILRSRREQGTRVRLFVSSAILVVIGSCWVLGVVRTGLQYKTALRTGRCRIVEGTVTVLQKGSVGRPLDESIRVGAEELSYWYKPSFSYEGIDYHWIIRNGGPLTNGAYARLHVFDEHILKVEIKR